MGAAWLLLELWERLGIDRDLPAVAAHEGVKLPAWVEGAIFGMAANRALDPCFKHALPDWRLGRVMWAMDRGMVSAKNLRELRRGGAHYCGRRARAIAPAGGGGGAVADRPLQAGAGQPAGQGDRRRQGRRQGALRDGAQPGAGGAGPGGAGAGAATHRSGDRSASKRGAEHTKSVCALLALRTMGRYRKKNRRGRLAIERAKVKAEERPDRKYLIVTNDDSLPPEAVALSYNQLAEVERAWRTMKSELAIRPMQHRKAERIRSHVLLCWLALLLVRLIEVTCRQT